MLSLAQKREILKSFEDKFGRFFYYFDKSPSRKKSLLESLLLLGMDMCMD
jgi:hypothetical protein